MIRLFNNPKGERKERTFLLTADSQEEMTKFVNYVGSCTNDFSFEYDSKEENGKISQDAKLCSKEPVRILLKELGDMMRAFNKGTDYDIEENL